MNLTEFLHQHSLEDSLLIGFYGGGNYGDELLMEVLAGLLQRHGATGVSIAYQTPERYADYHHDFGYPLVPMRNKRALLKALFTKKQLVLGGGGLWGMDSNFNLFALCALLLVARRVLGREVYLLAVGYYDSAPRLGRWSAWLAAKAANLIIARDRETYLNFKALQPNTFQDTDIAWYVDQLDLTPYQADLALLEERLHVTGKTLFMSLRRFRTEARHHLNAIVAECLRHNTDKQIIIALMEPQDIDPEGYQLLRAWHRHHAHVQVIDFSFNPLALFLFFRKHHEQLVFIGPQFHAILSAHLTGVPYLPLAYDNKVRELLQHIAPRQRHYDLDALRSFDVQRFIDTSYGEAV